MRLCFLASANSIHSVKWIRYFAEKGHEVHWISLTPQIEGSIENVKFYQIKGFERFFPLNLLINTIRIRKLIKKIKPDILHAHYAGANGVLGALSGFHPLIITVWGSDVLISAKSRIKGPLIKWALHQADLLTCDAGHIRETLIGYGTPPKKINIIYFGVDTKKFSPEKKDENLKNDLGIKNLPVIVSTRNLEPIYDIESLIKSVPKILESISEARIFIIGSGSESNKLKKMAKSLGVEKNVKFLGRIANDDLPKYLNIADIYVSMALSDAGISGSTAEAMACGLPVVITNTGENEKWVKNGEGGYLISVKNPEVLAERIIYLLKNPEKRLEFGQENRRVIRERNDYYNEMEKMEKIYKEFIQK